jgi:hypothetical protein
MLTVRKFFDKIPAVPIPCNVDLVSLEKRFYLWTKKYERIYTPGGLEYHRRYLNWLNGYKKYYLKLKYQIGNPPPQDWLLLYNGTQFSDYDDNEFQKLLNVDKIEDTLEK